MISTNPNISQCEPRFDLRQRLMEDLNVKGIVSCPDKIDLRAIIPVYDFSPGYKEKQIIQNLRVNVPLVGLNSDLVNLLPLVPPVSHRKIKLTGFYWTLRADAAGRAALVGETIYSVIRYAIGLNVFQFGVDRWVIVASPGNNLELLSSNYTIGQAPATDIIPRPNIQAVTWINPIELIFEQTGILQWQMATSIAFPGGLPAHTFEDLTVMFTYC